MKDDLSSLFYNCFDISLDFKPAKLNGFHPGQCAVVNYQEHGVGTIGRLHPNVEKLNDLNLPLYFLRLTYRHLT